MILSRALLLAPLVLEGDGRQFNLGQDMRPDARDQTFTVTGWKRQIDVTQRRLRNELTRTPTFAYFQGQTPQRQVQGVDGTIGFNVSAKGTATRIPAQAADDRRADFYHHPVVLVAAALAPKAKVTNIRASGTERIADIETEDGLRFALAVDESRQPVRIESRSYHPNLGDVTLATQFGDYQNSSGVRVPTRLTSRVDDFTTAEFKVTSTSINAQTDDLAAPKETASSAVPTPASPNVVAEVVAPGLWLLAGQTHHSVLAELSDHLLLIDAPQSEARSLAVIAKARELQPAKPLTTVVTTHHHFDHTAGIRAAMSEGLTIITHEGNRSFFEEMGKRPHTIVADVFARSPKPVRVETVGAELLLKDSARTVALYHIAGNPHSDTMLMVYFPSERVVVEVDAFSPGSEVNPYVANLLDNIERRKLRVDRVVPLHGTIAPFAELSKLRAAKTN
jgi:glyoxylase-like metal-dependent hydrolase (beta-lactamase superfamily II)